MHRFCLASLSTLIPAALFATEGQPATPVELSPVTVYSPLVANQEPASTFATPVSALRFEPLVDLQTRNFAEGQSDVLIRGGTFESSGFSLGALPIYDPQTGHYLMELPISPAMLTAPSIRTGADNAIGGWNATAGRVAYGWQPVRTGGYVSLGAGDNDLFRSELYSGYKSDIKLGGRTLSADASIAHSESDGSRRFGDHNLTRYNARIQLANEVSQTDLFVGRQDKEFAWPNMYAARNFSTPVREERENLKTQLVVLNHAVQFGADGDYLQFGGYFRRHNDHYAIPSFGASGDTYHETNVSGFALDGRSTISENTAIIYRAGVIADEIDSTSLVVSPINGRYDNRTQYYTGLFAEHKIVVDDGREWVLTAGANYDDSNRHDGELSPIAKLELRSPHSARRTLYISYSEASQLPSYTTLNNNNTGGLFIGNRNLGRSSSQNFEIGADADIGAWLVKAAIFYRRDKNLVDWTYDATALNTPGATSRQAVAVDLDTFGVELIARKDFGALGVIFGYTFLNKTDDLSSTRGSFYALDYATHRLTAAIIARLGAGFELRMDNEARIQEENALRRGNDDVVLSSLGLYYAVRGVKGLTLSAQVDNLWNTYYEEVPLVVGARREFSVGARYAW